MPARKKPRRPTEAAQPSLGEVLENALFADPDNPSTHAAYADWLTENGDPRGELIQLGLALEDASRSPAERSGFRAREMALMRTHGMEWLGELADFVINDEMRWRIRLARGWLDSLEIDRLTGEGARALAKAPQARLLRRLIIEVLSGPLIQQIGLSPLIESPNLGNVRVLQLGKAQRDGFPPVPNAWITGASVVDFVARLPRLEELSVLGMVDLERLVAIPSLTELRVLLHHSADGNDPSPAVESMERSNHLKKLTHLHLHGIRQTHTLCDTVVASGLMRRLQVLDLGSGAVNDVDAATLAACPGVRRLELLDLTNTRVSQAGVDRLKAAGITVRADHLNRRLALSEFEIDAHTRSGDGDMYDGEFEE